MGSGVIFRGQWIAVAVCVLAMPVYAEAHRLDEYLQAARISVDADRIRVEMDLSPGVDVADGILRAIDVDANGRIDAGEADAFAARVWRAVNVSLDGQPVPLRPDHRMFPTPDDMRQGTGTIRLVAIAPVARASGHRRLEFANAFLPGSSAYLVNALAPADPRITITGMQRDPLQRTFVLDYDVGSSRAWVGWSGTAMATIGLLIVGRMRKRGTSCGSWSRHWSP